MVNIVIFMNVHKSFYMTYFEVFKRDGEQVNVSAFVGSDLCKIPLSSVAQKIMSAMHSGDLVESETWRKSEKSE